MTASWVPFYLDVIWFKREINVKEDWKAAVEFYAGNIDLLLDMQSINPSRIGIADFGICPRHKDKPTLREWASENGMIELLKEGSKYERAIGGCKEVSGKELFRD